MRHIVSAKVLGTENRIIGYLIDCGTGHFVSTYTVKTSKNTQQALGLEKIEPSSIVYLMKESEMGELN